MEHRRPETPAVELKGVQKTYRGAAVPALAGIDLRVEQGEFVFLTGGSGSGKSTLIKTLILDEKASRGSIRVLGEEITRLPTRRRHELRRRVGTVFQDFKLLGDMTVERNVAYALEINGEETAVVQGRTLEALDLVGLSEKAGSYPNQLSGGEQQRVAVARALVARPRLLLADEPTGNLDPLSSSIVIDLLLAVNSAGTTVLVATHDEHTVNKLMKRVVTLKNGAIISDRRGGYHPERAIWRTRA